MKILFCTDGSRISYNALKNASAWLKSAIIDSICVIDWSFLPDEVNLDADNFAMSCANVADSVLDYAQDLILQYGFEQGKKIKSCGSAIESILEHVNNSEYDLILMGSNGKKGLQKWLGSVSQEIINSSKIYDYVSKRENNRQKLLLTTDGTACSEGIIENLLDEINFEGKDVHICMVNEDPKLLFLEGHIDSNWILDIQREQQRYAQNSLNSIKSMLEKHNVKVTENTILTGNPSHEIIQYARLKEIDLIVLGSRNKSLADRLLTGSESKRILENTSSDVLLVRCHI